jgi:hypothetical protein
MVIAWSRLGAVELIDRSRVASGRMTQQEAERQIALMNEIVDDYRVRCACNIGTRCQSVHS